MSRGPVTRAVRGGLTRRRLQTLVIGAVLLVSTAASVLALGLIAASSSPFDHAFAAQRGAHVLVVLNPALASPAELAATRRLPQVTAAAGPFAEANVTAEQGGFSLGPMTLVGRSSPGGQVDDLSLESGHWATRPGQLVLATDPAPGESMDMPLGSRITITGIPGRPVLTVVGTANSATSTADGWVAPAELDVLGAQGVRPAQTPLSAAGSGRASRPPRPTQAPGEPSQASVQMLYRFTSAGSVAAVRADAAAVAEALPAGAVTATQSYLSVRAQETSRIAPFVPFLVAFGVIGLVMSVLIVANVVSGAVAAGYRRIGILKSVGFTPGQVVAAYTGQVGVPAVTGCLAGVVLGNLMAAPLLVKTARVYGTGTLTVPASVDVTVPVAILALVAIAALVPAVRAGRLSAIQAIAAGRAPRPGHGYAAHRLLGRLRLPRPVTIGLAAPFARPARTVGTLVAVGLGATAVTFAIGLSGSLSRVVTGLSHGSSEQVQLTLNSGNAIGPAGQRAIAAALRAQPGTLHAVGEADQQVGLAGLPEQAQLTAFDGNAAWTGYDLIRGHWYTGPGQADVATGLLNATGKTVGDSLTLTYGSRQIRVRVVGEVFDAHDHGLDLITGAPTLASVPGLAQPFQYDVGLRPGTSADGYVSALGAALGSNYSIGTNGRNSTVVTLMIGIIGTLTLLLAIVAGLGVLSTVVLHTRERVHDLGVFKAVGMTPRQAIAMATCWVAGTGLVAGLLAVPAGVELHRYVLPAMASAASLGVPPSILDVYAVPELAVLALTGLVIAVAGGLLPASWAARTRTVTALHSE